MIQQTETIAWMVEAGELEKRAREVLTAWLREACPNLHELVIPCRVTLRRRDACSAWIGSSSLSSGRAVIVIWTADSARASLCSYSGNRIHHRVSASTVVEALRALAPRMPRGWWHDRRGPDEPI